MAFACDQPSNGQEQGRLGVRTSRQSRFVCRIVGFAKGLVGELFLLMVVVHGTEHLVVHTVEHRFAHPIFGWLVPLLKFSSR